jgi:hypothetical protein
MGAGNLDVPEVIHTSHTRRGKGPARAPTIVNFTIFEKPCGSPDSDSASVYYPIKKKKGVLPLQQKIRKAKCRTSQQRRCSPIWWSTPSSGPMRFVHQPWQSRRACKFLSQKYVGTKFVLRLLSVLVELTTSDLSQRCDADRGVQAGKQVSMPQGRRAAMNPFV